MVESTDKRIRVLFMGSGVIAGPTLRRLLERDDMVVVGVVTQPDRPKGRGLKVAACPIKAMSCELGLPVLDPEKVGAKASVRELADLGPDLIVVAAYGQYIKPAILDLPPMGAINLHPSLLPKYRGAAPIQMAVADGNRETGVTILYVSEEMDAGDIILQESVPIDPDETSADLVPRLAELGAELINKAIDQIRDGTAERTPQNPDEVLYVSKLTKADGKIDWTMPAQQIHDRVRGFTPWPGSFCAGAGSYEKRLKVIRARVEDGEGQPGRLLEISKDGPLVAAGKGAVRLLEVQPEGKAAMSGRAFLNGHPIEVGDKFR